MPRRVKIRDEGFVRNKAVYIALGILPGGNKEILGIWIEHTEGAKFWLRVMNEIKNRGIANMLIAVVDKLKGFPKPPQQSTGAPEQSGSVTGAGDVKTEGSLPVTLPGPGWPAIRPLDEAARLAQERTARVDKSVLSVSEPLRVRDLAHLAYVASKPCLVCGRNRTHAHHLKFAQPTALGRKVSDEFTVPLCSIHHRELHRHGDERVWWAARSIDALQVAEELWRVRRGSALVTGGG